MLSVSEHPLPLLRLKWEGLYVALSRVKKRDHIRLLLKRGDRSTMSYISKLKKCDYTDCFFRGFEKSRDGQGVITWNQDKARKELERLAEDRAAARSRENAQQRARRRKRRRHR